MQLLKSNISLVCFNKQKWSILRSFSRVQHALILYYRCWGKGFHGIKQQFDISGLFSCCLKYLQLLCRMFFIHLAITVTLFISDVANYGSKFLRQCQIYSRCRPIPMFFEETTYIVLVHVSTRINRIADTVVDCYMLSISTALATNLKIHSGNCIW